MALGVLGLVVAGSMDAAAASPGVLVVDFGGGEVMFGPDDASLRSTPIAEMVGPFAPYGEDPERREALLQAVRADWAPYAVDVLSSPPAQGDYAMVMVGPTNPFGDHFTGIATLDCDDQQSARSLAFAFYSADDGVPANVAATTISQEAAHGLGLEHVEGPGDIMLPVQAEGDSRFTDQCLPVSGPSECGAQHSAECGDAQLQNSHAELLRRFGLREPDHDPPSAEISSPSDGYVVQPDEALMVIVEAFDEQGLAEATLYVDGVGSSTDPEAPYGWELTGLPAGDYEMYVAVSDLGGNVTMSEVVEIRALGDSDGESEESSGGTVPAPPPVPPPVPTGSCAVGGPAHGGGWSWLLLPLVGWRRRSR